MPANDTCAFHLRYLPLHDVIVGELQDLGPAGYQCKLRGTVGDQAVDFHVLAKLLAKFEKLLCPDNILRRGALYVRPLAGVIRSVEVPTAGDMDEIVELATEKRLRAFLQRSQRAGLSVVPTEDPNLSRRGSHPSVLRLRRYRPGRGIEPAFRRSHRVDTQWFSCGRPDSRPGGLELSDTRVRILFSYPISYELQEEGISRSGGVSCLCQSGDRRSGGLTSRSSRTAGSRLRRARPRRCIEAALYRSLLLDKRQLLWGRSIGRSPALFKSLFLKPISYEPRRQGPAGRTRGMPLRHLRGLLLGRPLARDRNFLGSRRDGEVTVAYPGAAFGSLPCLRWRFSYLDTVDCTLVYQGVAGLVPISTLAVSVSDDAESSQTPDTGVRVLFPNFFTMEEHNKYHVSVKLLVDVCVDVEAHSESQARSRAEKLAKGAKLVPEWSKEHLAGQLLSEVVEAETEKGAVSPIFLANMHDQYPGWDESFDDYAKREEAVYRLERYFHEGCLMALVLAEYAEDGCHKCP